ncbi:MAG TPA: DUF1080 domain-containing protein [Candidatus Hydrogenedentes bacterium]|nr:DUF1080 domain-containing protein [Candidatus Hydrogenedentota bacterium]
MTDREMTRRMFLGGLAAATPAAMMAAHAQEAKKPKDKAKDKPKDGKKKDWKELFNGKDLTGWKPEGKAAWKVEDGVLIGTQGPGNAPGDLFTVDEFADFRLVVEYKLQWPANSGVWFRYQNPETSYQADMLEYKDPEAYTGTIYCPGRMFLSRNLDPKLEKKDDWNTMKITAKGGHLEVELNGVKVGDVEDTAIAKGRIGFQIHPGDEFKDMKLSVRKMRLLVL